MASGQAVVDAHDHLLMEEDSHLPVVDNCPVKSQVASPLESEDLDDRLNEASMRQHLGGSTDHWDQSTLDEEHGLQALEVPAVLWAGDEARRVDSVGTLAGEVDQGTDVGGANWVALAVQAEEAGPVYLDESVRDNGPDR
jgi:hypothetical protein